ncbi:hypothetical protein DPQ33_09490 [Oceanidesulfovibrio indonesiensis]|uniref:Uncharacterized protein n=1 Tax=Oceanidesulfovibrio indonesiensis TaxID=54767 RepID=A0A7M3MET0_9BACT|nr:hypothetical protein [Oceanidesulfovibrio indonesiensis]TVM17398.1 hypothetical protein DPQ33_09490 [Oceanidesulfovibrio indonesiensis]
MPISGIGGMTSPFDRQTFGAAVVSETLNTMNNANRNQFMGAGAPVDKQTFGAAVVSQTLNTMNFGSPSGSMDPVSQSYDFNQQVLGSYAGLGTVFNTYV